MLESHHTKRGHQKQMSPNKYIQRKTTDQIPGSTQTEIVSKLHGNGLRDDLIQEFKTVSTPIY